MMIMNIKRSIRTWYDKFKDLFLKALIDSEFRILFHSITVDGEKEFCKYSCLTLNKGILLWFWSSVLIRLWELYQKGKRNV